MFPSQKDILPKTNRVLSIPGREVMIGNKIDFVFYSAILIHPDILSVYTQGVDHEGEGPL